MGDEQQKQQASEARTAALDTVDTERVRELLADCMTELRRTYAERDELRAALAQAEREREALRGLCDRLLVVVADEDFEHMTTDELQPLIAEARAALDSGAPGAGEA